MTMTHHCIDHFLRVFLHLMGRSIGKSPNVQFKIRSQIDQDDFEEMLLTVDVLPRVAIDDLLGQGSVPRLWTDEEILHLEDVLLKGVKQRLRLEQLDQSHGLDFTPIQVGTQE